MPKKLPEPIEVLYEDNHCLAVVKPAGVLVVGDHTGDPTLLDQAKSYIRTKYRKPGNVFLGPVHRLDRPVSGVVLFARTSKAARRLSEQFRLSLVRKAYHAWVRGRPNESEGCYQDFLWKDSAQNVTHVVAADKLGARRARLLFSVLERSRGFSKLLLIPQTGRSHQIRVQLATRGIPIVGDVKYGGVGWIRGKVALHALRLEVDHPVRSEKLELEAAVPPDWNRLPQAL